MIFQYHIARITPSVAVCGREGCIAFHYLKFGRALGIPLTTTTNSFFIISGCPASSQSGTRMNKNTDAGTSPEKT
jgi:hypothetical protein